MSFRPTEIPLGAMRFNSDSQKLEYFNGEIWMQIHTFSPNLDGGGRGCFGGGETSPTTDTIDYVTIASTGDATDFGDLSQSRGGPGNGGCGSSTRGLFGSGITYSPTSFKDTIDYVTIAQTGNAVDFGNLSVARGDTAALSSTTRGIWAGGYTPTHQNVIDYVTIATLGNAADFGDLSANRRFPTAVSDPTRAVCYGGEESPAITNTIEYVTIASTGNAQDFGDGTDERYSLGGVSNAHGGL